MVRSIDLQMWKAIIGPASGRNRETFIQTTDGEFLTTLMR